ncbi:acetate and sugar kinases/Hsc70/actin family protein [Candidatus Venteria ishoeyi]|uniref:Uncharacterized protein n=1 Tax=Candidatus Venteria ishoeyi TaxID=1899563 RepID=A0A1H6F9R4_9GAMM|nr:hypothetical protein [Candidatus Venteria ishoeyi]SEH05745.1 Uncharacterised protein [Candidatus Venteria ishoeyi]
MFDFYQILNYHKIKHSYLLLKIFIAFTVSVCFSHIYAASADGSEVFGNHFIVVIRDSTLMKTNKNIYKQILETLPDLLYNSQDYLLKHNINLKKPLPVFEQEKDYLSVVFAAIHKDTKEDESIKITDSMTDSMTDSITTCKEFPALSAKPKHFFQSESVQQGLDQIEFSATLDNWLSSPCRGGGEYYASILVENLILHHTHNEMEKSGNGSRFFLRTFLFIIDNGATFGGYSPGTELFHLKSKKGVRDTEDVKEITDKTISSFKVVSSGEDWSFTVHRNGDLMHGYKLPKEYPLHYRIVEIKPFVASADVLLDIKDKIKLDRKAVSNERLDITPKIELKILPSNQLQAYELSIAFEASNNINWNIGKNTFPWVKSSPFKISISKCLSDGKCIKKDNGVLIHLFDLFSDSIYLTPEDKTLDSGKVYIKTRFMYANEGVYPHHFIDSNWKSIEIDPVETMVIHAETVPLKFPELVFNNKNLAMAYKAKEDDEKGLMQKTAKWRVLEERKILKVKYDEQRKLNDLINSAIIAGSALGATILLVLFLYIFYFHRPFRPKLHWQQAKKISLDFNQQPGGKLLVGVVTIVNTGKVPWFGKLAFNKKYPDVNVKFIINYKDLEKNGLIPEISHSVPLGFIGNEGSEKLLSDKAILVTHKTELDIFLATDAIKDFEGTLLPPDKVHSIEFDGENGTIPITVTMQWKKAKKHIIKEIPFTLEVAPEEPRFPLVTYQAAQISPEFSKGDLVEIGTFYFHSKAQHNFARPFRGDIEILALNARQLPLKSDIFSLEGGETVNIPSSSQPVQRKVLILCDDTNIHNPAPSGETYHFSLKGDVVNGSDTGPHLVKLQRDPSPAEIILEIAQDGGANICHTIEWEKQQGNYKNTISRKAINGKFEGNGNILKEDILNLPPRLVAFSEQDHHKTLFTIHVGNTGRNGNGLVGAEIKDIRWKFVHHVDRSIEYNAGKKAADLIWLDSDKGDIRGKAQGGETIHIKEGDSIRKIYVKVNTSVIKNLNGGRIGTKEEDNEHPIESCYHGNKRYEINGSIQLIAELIFSLDDGQQVLNDGKPHVRQHSLLITRDIGFEKKPHNNWLCIDYGTSAVVAAVGRNQKALVLNLQKIKNEDNIAINLSDYDTENPEKETSFLPSYIACDAEVRQNDKYNDEVRKGFPFFQPASRKVGDPDFVSFPVSTSRHDKHSQWVIYSLKSWLSQSSGMVELGNPIKFINPEGEEVIDRYIPLAEVMESTFAALANAYISQCDEFSPHGKLILTYPNTFTVFHQKILHDIAWRAFNNVKKSENDYRLGIDLPERIQLISESDAVAFYNCVQRLENKDIKKQNERVLVYDFGAGTLDLSLVNIQWDDKFEYPHEWIVENRIGVPIAGNHLDKVLANIVDKLLCDDKVLNNHITGDNKKEDLRFTYKHQLRGNIKGDEHKNAIRYFALQIKKMKHDFSKKYHSTDSSSNMLKVVVGSSGASDNLVHSCKNFPAALDLLLENKEKLEKSGKPYFMAESLDTSFDLYIPFENLLKDKTYKEYIAFVTEMVIDELIEPVTIKNNNGELVSKLHEKKEMIDVLSISGRGMMWPGLTKKVKTHFPNVYNQIDDTDPESMKSAAVRGAIASRQIRVKPLGPLIKPRLAILLEPMHRLIPEDEWTKENGDPEPIDIRAADYFCLVQVVIKNYSSDDFRSSSLRRHFYTLLPPIENDDNSIWAEDSKLYVSKEGEGEHTTIIFSNRFGESEPVPAFLEVPNIAAKPPWPIGSVTLDLDI